MNYDAKEPMLAVRKSIHLYPEKISFPLYAAPKYDGIRCWTPNGLAVSRSITAIENDYVRESISVPDLVGLDGELTVGPVAAENVYNATCAVNGNKVKQPAFNWNVFEDMTDPNMPFNERQVRVSERILDLCQQYPFLRGVESTRIETWEGLEAYEDMILGLGFEGVITRAPTGIYKFGRSTMSTQGMMKLKRFTDGEAEVIGFSELMVNNNPDIKDAFGHAKRSKSQAGLAPGGTLGKIQCRDLVTKVEFQIGMFKGLTLKDKQEIWDNQANYLGKIAKYQHFAHGAIDKPRHSKFLGWRSPSDMS